MIGEKARILDGALVRMGVCAGLILAIQEMLFGLDLVKLVYSHDMLVYYPGWLYLTVVCFDVAIGLVVALGIGLLSCSVSLSQPSARNVAAMALLVGIPWLYGVGTIFGQIGMVGPQFSAIRVGTVVGWTLVCALGAVTLFWACRRWFAQGMRLSLSLGAACFIYSAMLMTARGTVGFSVTKLFGSVRLVEILCVLTQLCLIFLLERFWRVRTVRVAAWLVVCGFVTATTLSAAGLGRRHQLPEQGQVPDERSERTAAPPNVILIVVDTLRADHLGCYGYPQNTSPNIDEFARKSDLYTRCYSTSSWTLPSHGSLFTGQFPRSHGAQQFGREQRGRLSEQASTLAEVLKTNGYATGAVVANHGPLNPAWGLSQGFSTYKYKWLYPTTPPMYTVTTRLLSSSFPQSDLFGHMRDMARPTMLDYPSGDVVFDEALRWIDQETGSPFFLFLNIMDVHAPYIPPSRFDMQLNHELTRLLEPYDVLQSVISKNMDISEQTRQRLVSLYDGSLAFIDEQFGLFMEGLSERGLSDNTLVILTADHGENLGEHGLVSHRYGLYNATIHVPLIVRRPGQESGARYDHIVQLTDVMPTVCESARVAIPREVQGIPLGATARIDKAYAEVGVRNGFVAKLNGDVTAVLSGYNKYIKSLQGQKEFFDLRVDAHERNNLLRKSPELAAEGERWLTEYHMKIPKYVEKDGSLLVTPDPDAIERLRALGYL